MTFPEYVRSRRPTNTFAGDFTADARGDKTLRDFKSWPELRGYLEFQHACPEAIEGAYQVWRGYLKAQMKRPANSGN